MSNIIDCYPFRVAGQGPEFLVLRRAGTDRLGDTWQAVHGRIEEGERAWETALRELKEETGLRPTELYQTDYVNTFYMAATDEIHHCPCFAARIDAGAEVVLNPEHTAYRWLPIDAVLGTLIWPGQREAIRHIEHDIINASAAKRWLRIELSG